MSNEAPFDGHSKESLQALARVIQLCTPDWPCRRLKCKRCRKYAEEAIAWVNPETYEVDENAIWGVEE